MESEKKDKISGNKNCENDSKNRIKKYYSAPVLKTYGKVTELTQGMNSGIEEFSTHRP